MFNTDSSLWLFYHILKMLDWYCCRYVFFPVISCLLHFLSVLSHRLSRYVTPGVSSKYVSIWHFILPPLCSLSYWTRSRPQCTRGLWIRTTIWRWRHPDSFSARLTQSSLSCPSLQGTSSYLVVCRTFLSSLHPGSHICNFVFFNKYFSWFSQNHLRTYLRRNMQSTWRKACSSWACGMCEPWAPTAVPCSSREAWLLLTPSLSLSL